MYFFPRNRIWEEADKKMVLDALSNSKVCYGILEDEIVKRDLLKYIKEMIKTNTI